MPYETGNPAYTAFFDALVDGRLRLGQTLTQDELCQALGFTLSPVREATTLLEAEKLITVRRKVGITIFYPDVDFIGDCFQFRGLLEREGLQDHLIVVTRWYGGKHLGGDRFRHVQTCVRAYLDAL